MAVLALQAAVAVLAVVLYYTLWRRKESPLPLPPGPKPLPIIGNYKDLPPPGKLEYEHWLELREKYGDLSSITVLGQPMILLHDKQAALDLLEKTSLKTSNRPAQPFGNEMCGFGRLLPTLQYDTEFRNQRKLIHQELGTKALSSRFADVLDVESRRFLFRVLQNPEDLREHIKTEASAIILKITYGYSVIARGYDPLVTLVESMMECLGAAFVPLAWMVDIFPILKHLPKGFPGAGTFQRTAAKTKEITDTVYDAPFQFVLKQMSEETHQPSFVSSSIQLCTDNEGQLSEHDADSIKYAASIMYGGGADTTVSNISSMIVAMIMYPEIQRKAQQEIDNVLGAGKMPELKDRERLPYTAALVTETLRWIPVVPIGTVHATSNEIIYKGYRIPKGSYLLPQIWWYLHNPSVYADPERFDPERFLSPRNEPDSRLEVFGVCTGPESPAFSGPWDTYNYAPTSRFVKPRSTFPLSDEEQESSFEEGKLILSTQVPALVLDFGLEVGGIVTIDYELEGAATTLGLAFSEARDYIGMESDSSRGDDKDIDGALFHTISSAGPGKYIMPLGKLRDGFRYLTTFLKNTDSISTLHIRNISLEITFQPTWIDLRAYQGYFYTENDQLLNKIWYSGAWTVQTNCIHGKHGMKTPSGDGWDNIQNIGDGESILVDGAKRDRFVWNGDMGTAVPSSFVSTGDLESTKNALIVIYNQQASNGQFPKSGPLNVRMTSDTGIIKVTGKDDWGRFTYSAERASASILLYRALIAGAAITNWIPSLPESERDNRFYTDQARALQKSIIAEFWDDSIGAFKDSPGSTLHPQDANSMAIAFGPEAPELPGNVAPFIASIELQGHFRAGRADRVLQLIHDLWGWYLSHPNGTQSTVPEGYNINDPQRDGIHATIAEDMEQTVAGNEATRMLPMRLVSGPAASMLPDEDALLAFPAFGFPEILSLDLESFLESADSRPLPSSPDMLVRLEAIVHELATTHERMVVLGKIKQEFDHELAQSVFTTQNLEYFLWVYFQRVQPYHPIILPFTFRQEKASLPLLLAIFIMGAMFSPPTDASISTQRFSDIADELIFEHPSMRWFVEATDNSDAEMENIEILQAAYTIMCIQHSRNDPMSRRKVRVRRLPVLAEATRRCGALKAKHPPGFANDPAYSFDDFVRQEQRISFASTIGLPKLLLNTSTHSSKQYQRPFLLLIIIPTNKAYSNSGLPPSTYQTTVMPSLKQVFVALSIAAIGVAQHEVAHDEVQGYDTKVPDDLDGELMLKYQPWLKVFDGCVPYPAVQDDGGVSGGLQDSGDMDGGCGDSDGQVYARGKTTNENLYAIMYAWYTPKDMNVDGGGSVGHRHDWEFCIVWLDKKSTSAKVQAVSVSQHGDVITYDRPETSFDGTRPLIGYLRTGGTHHVDVTEEKGGEQPLLAWQSMSKEARDALENHDFGSANVPFIDRDNTYDNNLIDGKP
ncbi:Multifunctional cytochrome P450 monooxygenase af510 [Paramyrothecium foliicola]|nr:Multifunctional cytochrome P450 monooxygenase af510 [Paramyrothecium foliicola]